MKKYLLNEKAIIEILVENKIGIVDGGARGELFRPFKYINKDILQIFRFDPEPETDIVSYTNDDIVFKKALWHSEGRIKLNVAVDAPTSSVYSFNRELQIHIDPFYKVRKTKEIVEVDTISLDTIIKNQPQLKIDFMANMKTLRKNDLNHE